MAILTYTLKKYLRVTKKKPYILTQVNSLKKAVCFFLNYVLLDCKLFKFLYYTTTKKQTSLKLL